LHLITGTGNPQLVALNDGSLVDVNSNSSLKVLLLPAERRVEINEGEAHFEVAHDSSRPFIVNAGGLSVRAVGTAFTVRVTKQEVEVLVVEGKVAVSQNTAAPIFGKKIEPPTLVAEERLRSIRGERKTLVVEHVEAKEIKEALAWHISITHFSNRPLSEVVALFNRRNAAKIMIADDDLATRRIGGAFAIDRPLAFVRILERDGDIHAEQRSDNTVVLHRVR
jgi:transmembrane sensor